MTSTATTRTFDIYLELSDGGREHAGQAPGTNRSSALQAFHHDAIKQGGELLVDDGRFVLEVENPDGGYDRFVAEPAGTVEVAPDSRRVDSDSRYTAEAIAGYTADELTEHLRERREQLAQARESMTRYHEHLAQLEDPDSSRYADTLANLGCATREHAIQKRIIRHLEQRLTAISLQEKRSKPGFEAALDVEILDAAIADYGMPCGVEEAGDLDVARELWIDARTALENETDDDDFTAGAIADRVAGAYAVTYGYALVDAGYDHAAQDGARADAETFERLTATRFGGGVPIDAAITRALMAIITDPKIRYRLDAKALEQARNALGLGD